MTCVPKESCGLLNRHTRPVFLTSKLAKRQTLGVPEAITSCIAGQRGFCFNDGKHRRRQTVPVNSSPARRLAGLRCVDRHIRRGARGSAEATLDWLLSTFLRRFIRSGSLTITTASGRRLKFGDGSGPPVAVRFAGARAQRSVLFNPALRLGEAYMDGTFIVEQGSIADVLAILLRQERIAAPRWLRPANALRYVFRRLHQFNPRSRSRRNVSISTLPRMMIEPRPN